MPSPNQATPLTVVRLNRMVLGVATPVADFCRAYFGVDLVDVDTPEACAGADVVILGRQQLRDDGQRLAADLVAPLLAVARPRLLVATLPDEFDPSRYARDLGAWHEATAQGVPTVVLEVRLLRALRTNGLDALIATARTHETTACQQHAPVLWLSGRVLKPE